MAKNNGSHIWWWIVPALVIVAGLGYYLYTKTGPKTEKTQLVRDISPDRAANVSGSVQRDGSRTGGDASLIRPEAGEQASTEPPLKDGPVSERFPIEKKETSESAEMAAQGPIEELFVKADKLTRTGEAVPGKGEYCTIIHQQLLDFFDALDAKAYFRRFKLEKDAYTYFAQILTKLTAQPPQPAGEGIQPTTMLANIYFFSRALDRQDLRVIKAVVENERDTMEFDMETFYRWLMLGKDCPNPGNVRPSFDIIYRYAGFFVNTTGGRAYLFRRSLRLRLLVSYYCVLIVYQADRLGKNSYGLDMVPFIEPLKDELTHHPELEFQDRYISTLNRVENYYLQRR